MRADKTPAHVIVVGAGSAGLAAARELARAGRRVTVLEARERCGGRILPLSTAEFGYPTEGGAEFIHGAAPVTLELMRDAGLRTQPRGGTRWSRLAGHWTAAERKLPHADRFFAELARIRTDLPIAEFLERHFAGPAYTELRRRITRTVEGYDAADPKRASTLALREEWLAQGEEHGRIAGGYGALIDYLCADSVRHGATIRFGAAVGAIEETGDGVLVRCRDGQALEAGGVVLTVPLPILSELNLPPLAAARAAVVADIGFGNVIKFLFRFASAWWTEWQGEDRRDLAFVLSDAAGVPTWWSQYPQPYPVLTGWCAGPRADRVAALSGAELIGLGLKDLAEIFDETPERIESRLVAGHAINWGADPFARGAYSYATVGTRHAQAVLRQPAGRVFFSGEALYTGPDMGTVEAALASGRDTARLLLASP